MESANMKPSKYLIYKSLFFVFIVSLGIISQSIAQKPLTDSLQKKYPSAYQQSPLNQPKLSINSGEPYVLDKIPKQNILVVFRNKIYAKDSPEFIKIQKELSLYVAQCILDRNSRSGIQLIQFFEVRK